MSKKGGCVRHCESSRCHFNEVTALQETHPITADTDIQHPLPSTRRSVLVVFFVFVCFFNVYRPVTFTRGRFGKNSKSDVDMDARLAFRIDVYTSRIWVE